MLGENSHSYNGFKSGPQNGRDFMKGRMNRPSKAQLLFNEQRYPHLTEQDGSSADLEFDGKRGAFPSTKSGLNVHATEFYPKDLSNNTRSMDRGGRSFNRGRRDKYPVAFDLLNLHKRGCRQDSPGFDGARGGKRMFKNIVNALPQDTRKKTSERKSGGQGTTVFWNIASIRNAQFDGDDSDTADGDDDFPSCGDGGAETEIVLDCCLENNPWITNMMAEKSGPKRTTDSPQIEESGPSSETDGDAKSLNRPSGSNKYSGLNPGALSRPDSGSKSRGSSWTEAGPCRGGYVSERINCVLSGDSTPRGGEDSLLSDDDQQQELLALASIFNEEDILVIDEGKMSGRFYAHPRIPKPYFVCYQLQDGAEKMMNVDYLPPLELSFHLPQDYPKSVPPSFVLSCMWLSNFQLNKVSSQLDILWEKNQGQEILYTWMDFLINDLLAFLGETTYLDIKRLINRRRRQAASRGGVSEGSSRKPPSNFDYDDLIQALRRYDEQKKCESFDSSWFTCKICFTEKQGHSCMALSKCRHVFCCDCLTQYFSIQITDGSVHTLACPEEGCSNQALPNEVRKLVGDELFARYDKLLLQASLNSMSDVVYCPRTSCQCAVVVEPESTTAMCPSCTHAFCIFCKRTSHGLNPCSFKEDEKRQIVQNYLNGDQEIKSLLEKRYGRLTVRRLVDEVMSEEWMQSNSKKCPRCQSSIEKTEGCNKMVCWRCNTVFCWLCLTRLKDANPYQHFNNPGSPCFNQLFHGALPEEEGAGHVIEGFDVEDFDNLENDDYI